ncbi:MAG: cytochrome c biogenesis protein [Aggregatilineales bacterium]
MSAVQNVTMPDAGMNIDKKSDGRIKILQGYTIATVLGVLAGGYMALIYAGADVVQGEVQRLFYFHLPVFFGAFAAFTMTVVGGVQYLRTRKEKWDTLALAGVEVGIALALINLATGAIWARPIWNTWWTWDPRLTSAAIMVLTYAAYLMLRSGIDNPERRRRFASVYGILAISTVIFTTIVIRIRPDTIHPAVIGTSPSTGTEGAFDITPGVGAAMVFNLIVWIVFVTPVLMWWRIRLQDLLERAYKMKMIYLEGSA